MAMLPSGLLVRAQRLLIDTDDDEEGDFAYLCSADVFLTGKAVRSEIRLKDLSPEDRAKFVLSMEKAQGSWPI